jgi:hypothetical protein
MRKISSLTLSVLLVLALASASFALVKKMDVAEIRDASSDVVIGKVTGAQSGWEDGLIYTYYSVKVNDRAKGTPPEYITVRVPGGEVEDVNLFVYDAADLEMGEDAVLFLNRAGGHYEVTGWFQGKYSIKNGKVEDTGLDPMEFATKGGKSQFAKPPSASGYKLCGYDWKCIGMSGGKYHSEAWEVNPANNDGMSSGSVNSAIQSGANAWTGAGACFTFGSGGSSSRSGAVSDGYNVVSFGNTGGAVAATYIWVYRSNRKCISEVDLVFDHVYWNFGAPACGSGSKFDLQNVATHEFGHWLCLADLYGAGDYNQTMYGYVDYGECKNNDLYTGDIAGIKAIYGTCAGMAPIVPEKKQVAEGEGTTIQFAVPKAGVATVQVYNVMGQVVSTLSEGYLEAGQQSFGWDGRDSAGNRVASGVYFVTVRGADYSSSSKITLVR